METDDEPQHVSGEVEGKRSLMRDANGDFNWGMLALIVGVVLVLVAIAWIVGKILAFFGPVLIVLLIVFLIMHFAKGDK
jgi:cobalamin biosynthesis protein CobD/CbiB